NINIKKAIIIAAIIFTIFLGMFSVRYFRSIYTSAEISEQESTSPSPSVTPSDIPAQKSVSTPKPEPEPIYANIVSAGDCVLHELFQKSALTGKDAYDFYPIFEAIEPYTKPASYSLISFESAATNKRNDYTGYPLFNCPPEIFDAFNKVGLDMVNNSNNHQLDRKLAGMFETKENIEKAGLDVIGIFNGEKQRYKILELNGIKVAIMAYTYSCNMNELALTAEERYNHLSLIDEERMEKEITEMEEKADITVIAMHWGIEYQQKPSAEQKKLAENMISWGADVILGSHPHVVQPSEIIEYDGENKYVIYSMGNFVSNQRRGASGYPKTKKELCEDSMLVNIEFIKDPITHKTSINKVEHIPTWLWRYLENGVYKFKVIPVPALDYYQNGEYPPEVLAEVYESYKRTMSLVTDYRKP
ncbi:MAG: CapA family protein, partial [Clostridiaceae bacterium]|nr:CapA family protein [Clostridiaceae bacterium]